MLMKQVLLVILTTLTTRIVAVNFLDDLYRSHSLSISKSLNGILQLCFSDHLNPLIITEKSSKYVFYEPKPPLASSIIVINNEFKTHHHARNQNSHIATFVLTNDQLNNTISQLRSTPWWNTESYFFIIEPSSLSCADASKALAFMWRSKILSVVYLCSNDEAVMLYTFNPFNSYAPPPWKWFQRIQDKPESRWTLYEYQYRQDKTHCPVIMFDKTLKLDDYEIRALIEKNLHPKDVPTAIPIRLNNYQKDAALMGIPVMAEVLIRMKVNVILMNTEMLTMTKDGKFHGNQHDLRDIDIYLKTVPLNEQLNCSTYPDIMLTLVLLGQKRPFLRTEDKIFNFFHLNILVPSVAVFLLSAIILKMNHQQEYISALLKMWQLFLGNNIPQVFVNTPTRIFFIGVFWLVIIFNGTFQSKLASFLTKPERVYINSLKDAFKFQYHIYGFRNFMISAGYLELPPEKRRYIHFLNTHKCVASVLNNSQALCLSSPNYSARNAVQHRLHVSHPVHTYHTVYWVSLEFPLKRRINTVILRLQASGVVVQLYKKIFDDRLDYLHGHENDETKFQNRPIGLYDLLFIFKFFIIGHICSLAVFIIELRHR